MSSPRSPTAIALSQCIDLSDSRDSPASSFASNVTNNTGSSALQNPFASCQFLELTPNPHDFRAQFQTMSLAPLQLTSNANETVLITDIPYDNKPLVSLAIECIDKLRTISIRSETLAAEKKASLAKTNDEIRMLHDNIHHLQDGLELGEGKIDTHVKDELKHQEAIATADRTLQTYRELTNVQIREIAEMQQDRTADHIKLNRVKEQHLIAVKGTEGLGIEICNLKRFSTELQRWAEIAEEQLRELEENKAEIAGLDKFLFDRIEMMRWNNERLEEYLAKVTKEMKGLQRTNIELVAKIAFYDDASYVPEHIRQEMERLQSRVIFTERLRQVERRGIEFYQKQSEKLQARTTFQETESGRKDKTIEALKLKLDQFKIAIEKTREHNSALLQSLDRGREIRLTMTRQRIEREVDLLRQKDMRIDALENQIRDSKAVHRDHQTYQRRLMDNLEMQLSRAKKDLKYNKIRIDYQDAAAAREAAKKERTTLDKCVARIRKTLGMKKVVSVWETDEVDLDELLRKMSW